MRQIAPPLGRAPSTICREAARSRASRRYRAVDADDRGWRRARRRKRCLLARNPEPCTYVAARLRDDWSPEQIAGTLREGAGSGMRVSHETSVPLLPLQGRGRTPGSPRQADRRLTPGGASVSSSVRVTCKYQRFASTMRLASGSHAEPAEGPPSVQRRHASVGPGRWQSRSDSSGSNSPNRRTGGAWTTGGWTPSNL